MRRVKSSMIDGYCHIYPGFYWYLKALSLRYFLTYLPPLLLPSSSHFLPLSCPISFSPPRSAVSSLSSPLFYPLLSPFRSSPYFLPYILLSPLFILQILSSSPLVSFCPLLPPASLSYPIYFSPPLPSSASPLLLFFLLLSIPVLFSLSVCCV